jgi:hypothetical protein
VTYFADLSPYAYFRQEKPRRVYNIGWLDAAQKFETGFVDPEIVTRLEQISCCSVNQTRGLHDCNICSSEIDVIYKLKDKTLLLGDAEIRVFSAESQIFAAPTLLLHYITAHNYLPPTSFLNAVKNGPVPPLQDYFDQLKAQDYEWVETSTRERPVERRPPLSPPSWMAKR